LCIEDKGEEEPEANTSKGYMRMGLLKRRVVATQATREI
jgi:hypothetical protein